MLKKIFALVAAVMVAVPAVAAAPDGWRTYNNARFGYTTCYPETLRPLRASDNNDGRVFRAPDAKISVWGENNVFEQSLGQHAASLRTADEVVTYRAVRPNWIVQSGTKGALIFWRKSFKRDDQFITIEVHYAANQRQKYDAMIKSISSCSTLGQPAY